jgi:hypothetical protein
MDYSSKALNNFYLTVFIKLWYISSWYTRDAEVIQPFREYVEGILLSSVSLNIVLNQTPFMSPTNCVGFMAYAAFQIGLHMICLHVRVWRIVINCIQLKRNQDEPIKRWKRIAESGWTWWIIENVSVVLTLFITPLDAAWRSQETSFVSDTVCYIDLGQSVSLLIFFGSLISLMAASIFMFYLGNDTYSLYETICVIVIQIICLGPAMYYYTSAHQQLDFGDLNTVRKCIIAYTFAIFILGILPVITLNYKRWWSNFGKKIEYYRYRIFEGPIPKGAEPLKTVDDGELIGHFNYKKLGIAMSTVISIQYHLSHIPSGKVLWNHYEILSKLPLENADDKRIWETLANVYNDTRQFYPQFCIQTFTWDELREMKNVDEARLRYRSLIEDKIDSLIEEKYASKKPTIGTYTLHEEEEEGGAV